MPSYWERRALESVGRMESAVQGAIPELVQSFEQAKKQLSNEIFSFYGKYAQENKVSLQEVQKVLSFAELREFKGNLREYEKLARESIGTFNLQVSNLSKQARITRLQALETQCDAILQNLYQEQKRLIEGATAQVYTQEYYRSLFNVEQYTGFQFTFSQVSASAIEQVLKTPVMGADISTRLWRQDMDTGFKIRQTLNEMFITGKPPQYFAEELQNVIGAVRVMPDGTKGTGKKYEAYRVLYNESSYAMGQASLDAYKADGIDQYKIIATLDGSTSTICREQDGRVYRVDEAVTGVNYPPFHVNCRTTTGAHIPNLKNFDGTRLARDPVTGKSVRVPKQNYKQWYKANVEKHGKDFMQAQESKHKNRYADKKQYEKYKVILGKDMPNSFANFQEMKYNNSIKWKKLKSIKQISLNAKPYQEISRLDGALGNLETRLWYKSQDEKIPELIDTTLPLEQQARQASDLRNMHRTQARNLMQNQQARRQLDILYPNQPFEYYVEKYSRPNDEGVVPTLESVYRKIISKSTKTNKAFDRKAGVKDED